MNEFRQENFIRYRLQSAEKTLLEVNSQGS